MTKIDRSALPADAIQIYPSGSNWNDFGHVTLFCFLLPNENSAREFRFSFLDERQPANVIKDTLSKHEKPFAHADEFPQFFSLHYNIDEYRKIVSSLGVGLANSTLLEVHDLVAIRQRYPVPQWVDDAVESRVFNLSFMRTSASFYAFYHAAPILTGLKEESLNSVASHIQFEFKLSAFANSHQFNFRFEKTGIIPNHIAVLIGKNGVGKSQTLKNIVLSALFEPKRLTDGNGNSPSLSQIIAISTPGETDSTFPRQPQQSNSGIKYIRLSALPHEKAYSGGQTLPEVILQLARGWDSTIAGVSRWDIFCESIAKMFKIESLAISKRMDLVLTDAVPPPPPPPPVSFDSLRGGGEQNSLEAMRRLDKSGQIVRTTNGTLIPLSSGQLSFMRLAAQLCLNIENGSLILIDEPETHLHPNMITDFVSMLNKILELSGSISIVATHSAYLVREVSGSQVHIIKASDDGSVEIGHPRLRTFGADVGAISNFVFGDDIINRLIEEVADKLKSAPELYPNWRETLKAQLSTEAVMYLMQQLEINEKSAK